MDTDEYRTEVMRKRAREIAYNLASDGGISDADIAECCDLTMDEVHDIVVEVALQIVYTYTGHHCCRQVPKSVHLYRPQLQPVASFKKCTPIYAPPQPVASFKNAHLYIPRPDLLQKVYTYTSHGICWHPFQIVYTYMYPDAASALPAALTL